MERESFNGIMGIGMWGSMNWVINRARGFIIIKVVVGMKVFLTRISWMDLGLILIGQISLFIMEFLRMGSSMEMGSCWKRIYLGISSIMPKVFWLMIYLSHEQLKIYLYKLSSLLFIKLFIIIILTKIFKNFNHHLPQYKFC